MSNNLVKCVREKCNNYRNENSPLGLCFVCREYMLDVADKIKKSTKNIPYKTKDELKKYDYNVCYMKGCKSRVFMRNKCKKHYIEHVSNNL